MGLITSISISSQHRECGYVFETVNVLLFYANSERRPDSLVRKVRHILNLARPLAEGGAARGLVLRLRTAVGEPKSRRSPAQAPRGTRVSLQGSVAELFYTEIL
ncbi:Eukaryotic Translation Initiation Factor 4 Gamma 2 [Manis pentadactyla]|nr:Eukaryotic Translation Initiation Factor 4 Gamma 2 [Manis pentadactyla]